MGRPRVVRGTGRLRPTLAVELLRAREQMGVVEAVGLAVREIRRGAGLGQRAYAESRGWSKTHQHRLEADAGELRLRSVVEALKGTGIELMIARVGTDTAVDARGQRIQPSDWPDTELIARDARGRRFPAHRSVRRATGAPTWWTWRHGASALATEPEWTTETGGVSAASPTTTAGGVSAAGSSVTTMTPIHQPSEPMTVDRPVAPDDYGIPQSAEGQLAWEDVESRLVGSMHYWISSVRPDGTPHSVPRWGVWVDGRFWYDGAPTTRHTRNVEANPVVTLTLESGTEVVIVEGDSVATRADADRLGPRLSQAFAKYADSGYAPGPEAWSGEDGGGLRVITPRRVLAWFDFPQDCTRFRFGADESAS